MVALRSLIDRLLGLDVLAGRVEELERSRLYVTSLDPMLNARILPLRVDLTALAAEVAKQKEDRATRGIRLVDETDPHLGRL